jgi:hypothetical protein
MNESLFQFIWQHSLYNGTALHTASGEPLTVIYSGRLNRDAGPDFLEAKIKIGNTILVGNVELHTRSSDWLRHGHQHDPAYKNLALHVVYDDDVAGVAGNIPVLVLRPAVAQQVIDRYAGLVNTSLKLPAPGSTPR